MNDRQRRRFERLVRVRDFGLAQAAHFRPETKGSQCIANFVSIVKRIEDLDAQYSTSKRNSQQSVTAKKELREELREAVGRISRTARTIALEMPEIKDKFRLPSGYINDQQLLSTARSFAVDTEPLMSKFLEYDMASEFFDSLKEKIEEFNSVVNRQNLNNSSSVSNRTSIDSALEQGEQELERFDTIFRNKFQDDAAMMAAWESASHLEQAPRRKTEQPASPPQTSPQP